MFSMDAVPPTSFAPSLPFDLPSVLSLSTGQDDRKYKCTEHKPHPVRAEPALRQAQDDRKYQRTEHKNYPVRAEPVLRQAQDDRKYKCTEHKPHPVRAEPVEALPPVERHFDKPSPFDRLRMHGHFDKLSANGIFFVS
jgi:hypothetical protein